MKLKFTLLLTLLSLLFNNQAQAQSACNGLTYCAPLGDSGLEWIESFEMGSINNTSGNSNGYGDFTDQSTDITKGLFESFTCTPGYPGSSFTEVFTVWIDFNSDGDFNDAGEQIFQSEQTQVAVSGSFLVPADAVVGNTTMRVRMDYLSANDPCENSGNQDGEVEDYCVNILAGNGCYLSLLNISDVTETTALASWAAITDAESYNVQFREIGTMAWTTINSVTASTTIDLLECTLYEAQLETVCAGGVTSGYGPIVEFITFGCGACYDFSYCEAFANSSAFDFIGAVSFGSMNNVSGDNGGYIDFSDDFGLTVRPDSTYDLVLTPEWPGGIFDVAWSVYIDYNADGDFDDANELVFSALASGDIQTTTVTVPLDATFGLTKMRVIMRESVVSEACEIYTWGEVEDYCITILPSVLPCLVPLNLDTTNVTDQSVEMIWEMDQYELAIGYIIRFKEVVETDWMEFSTEDPTYTAYGLTLCTDYEFQVRTVCPQDFSEYTESFLYSTSCVSSTEDLTKSENINALNVYPNPFSDQISVDFELKKSSNVTIKMTNLSGQLLQLQELDNLGEGNHHAEFQPTGLAAGMYIIQVATEDEVVIRKVVKK